MKMGLLHIFLYSVAKKQLWSSSIASAQTEPIFS